MARWLFSAVPMGHIGQLLARSRTARTAVAAALDEWFCQARQYPLDQDEAQAMLDLIAWLEDELPDLRTLTTRCGLGDYQNPLTGMWDFLIFDQAMVAQILATVFRPVLLHGERVGLHAYLAADYSTDSATAERMIRLLAHCLTAVANSPLVLLRIC